MIFQGDTIYLWFNENTNRMLLQDLLSVDESLPVSQISLFSGTLPETGTSINQKASNVIKNWQQVVNKSSLPLVLLRPNVDQYYSNVMSQLLCEDKTVNRIESYDNYLVIMHKKFKKNFKKTISLKSRLPQLMKISIKNLCSFEPRSKETLCLHAENWK